MKTLYQILWALLVLVWGAFFVGEYNVITSDDIFPDNVKFIIGALAALVVHITAGIFTYRISKRNESRQIFRNMLIIGAILTVIMGIMRYVAVLF